MPPQEIRLTRLASILTIILLGPLAAACNDACGDSEDRRVPLSELPCNRTDANGVWESHPFPPFESEECNWLEFRGCSTYEIEHPLGRKPIDAIGWTAFNADGYFSTPASGNSFVVDGASDSTIIIRNAQNQLFYLRLVLE